MKFIAYNGYYKFYPEYHREERDISRAILREQLVQVRDYYTFSKLKDLKSSYLKGEMILDIYKCPKTVETNEDSLENIFLLTGLFYDYVSGGIFKGSSSSVITFNPQNNLPVCGLDYPIIRGMIKDNKIIIQ